MDVITHVKKLYAGCGMESEMVELMGLLNDLVDAYHGGELSDSELLDFASKLCGTIVAHMNACGKTYTLDMCVNDVTNLIKVTAPKGGFRSLRSLIRKKRSTAGGKPSGLIP